jgi:hypothetical protein
MGKNDSLYNHGMKPLMYSTKKSIYDKSGGWARVGSSICHYQNNFKNKNGNNFFTFSFEVIFDYSYDEVFFSHFHPYRYSDHKLLMSNIHTLHDGHDRLRVSLLCKSIAKNDLDLLIITNFMSEPALIANRRCVIVTGRVHPGES